MRELFILAWTMAVGGMYGAIFYHWYLFGVTYLGH